VTDPGDLDDDLLHDDLAAPPPTATEGVDAPNTLYGSVAEWVADFLAVAYAREVRVNGAHHYWCSQWWRHPEAFDRLDALWRAWEALRRDPTTGPAVWWKDYADPLMTVLLSRDGPFGQCRAGRHAPANLLVPPLPADAPDPLLFPPRH